MTTLHALVELAAGQSPVDAFNLPDGVVLGITWGVGLVIIGLGAAFDAAATERLRPLRMGVAALLYYSGWLSLCIGVHSPEWWAEQLTDPNWKFAIQMVALGLNVFVLLAIFGLVINKVSGAGGAAHDKMGLSSGDAKKFKLTGGVVGWTWVAAWTGTTLPSSSTLYTHLILLISWPGNHLAGYLVHQLANGAAA